MLNKWHQIHGPWRQTANVQIILHPTQTAGDIQPCLRLRLVLAASSTQCTIPTIHSVPCGLHFLQGVMGRQHLTSVKTRAKIRLPSEKA